MWALQPLEDYKRRLRNWPKKYKRELLAVHDNLDTFLKALQGGQRPCAARFGFIHCEPGGVLAIDQKRGGPHLRETRLYIYPDETGQRVFVITLGDKDSQTKDIQCCKEFIEQLRNKGAEKSIGREDPHVDDE